MTEESVCWTCSHPAKFHGTREQLEYGPEEGCAVGVYAGRGFARRLIVCLCEVPQEELAAGSTASTCPG